MSTTSPHSPQAKAKDGDRKSLGASVVGQLLEWYEWSSYAVFAPFIAAAMFDKSNPTSALLATFGVFAIGFLARPLGGIIFGIIADKKGRKNVLMTTILMMAAASVVIGILPSYESIGVWASLGLLIIRVLQGFAHGGESAAANSYIPEIAPKHKRGQWGSLVYVAIFGGSVIAYTLGGMISLVLSEEQIASWGWRIPFLLGAVAAVIAMIMRRHMQESEVYEQSNKPASATEAREEHHDNLPHPDPRFVQVKQRKKHSVLVSILLVIGMVSGVTSSHYTWSSYVSTYAIKHEGMSTQGTYWVTVVAQVIALISLPLWGRLSDRIGRKPVIYTFAVLLAILQLPMMNLIDSRPWTLLVASTVALVVVSAGGALLASVMSEVFPTNQRTKGIGLAYSISVAVFGGTAPYIFQMFVARDLAWMSSVYVIILCLLTLISMRFLPETKGIELQHA
nr:MFS transporter [Corynebacterium pelargi]